LLHHAGIKHIEGTFLENIRPNHNFIIGYRHICFSMRCTQMERNIYYVEATSEKERIYVLFEKYNLISCRYQWHLILIKNNKHYDTTPIEK